MNGVKLSDCNLDLSNFEDIIAICTFGSYNEPCFNKNRSDIDIMVLLKREIGWEAEFDIEDYLQTTLPECFNHKDIHYTFINEFVYPFSDMFIESKDKIIIKDEDYLDYILGYSCFKRDRENYQVHLVLYLKKILKNFKV